MHGLRTSRFFNSTAVFAIWVITLGSFSASRLSLFLQASGEACCGMEICCCAANGGGVCACSPEDGAHTDMKLVCGVPDGKAPAGDTALPLLHLSFKAILESSFLLPEPSFSSIDDYITVNESDGFPLRIQAPPKAFRAFC